MGKKEVKKAAALAYTPGEDGAPKVIATGKGVIAEKMLEKAKEKKIPIYEDAYLADTLVQLKLGSEIPTELYDVVASILTFISNVDETAGKKFGRGY